MKRWKALRKFLSVFVAVLLIIPGAMKIDAAEFYYPIDAEDSVVLNAQIVGETSTNDHTFAKAIWTYGDSVYLMTDSTHDIKEIKLTGSGGTITAAQYFLYGTADSVKVGDKVFYPDSSQGNTKDSHLTVARFSLSEFIAKLGLNGGNTYGIEVISEQGKGHWILGSLSITIPKAAVKITKTWENGPKYPAKIQLYRDYQDDGISFDPQPVGNVITLTEGVNNLNYLVSNLAYTDNLGRIFKYFAVEQDIPEGYTATYSPVVKTFENGVHLFTLSIVNKYTPPKYNIEVTKVWKDLGGALRPSEITFKLYRGSETTPLLTQTANSGSGWKTTFMDLPKTELNGTPITYRVEEVPVPGYTTSINGFTVTNTRSEKMNLPVEKIWKDEPGTAARPATVTFNLLQNGNKISEVTFGANEGWKASFMNIEKFDGEGNLYTYTITENAVPGYTGSISGTTITNTRTGVIDIPVMKVWRDINTSARPDEITIHLLRNGEPYKTAKVKSTEGWTYTFEEEARFDKDGKPYTFTVEEEVPSGYKGSVSKNENGVFVLTNVRVNEITILGEKTWLDDGTGRPGSITVVLLQNGEPYDSKVVTKNEEGKWLFSFSKVPEFNEDGIPYVYTLKELTVSGYLATIGKNEDGSYTIKNLRVGTVEVTGEKTWLDDGTGRPASITVKLLRNDVEVDSKLVTPVEGKWLFSFKDLPQFDEKGLPYKYTIKEVPVEGYASTVTKNEDGSFTIKNLRTGLVDIAGRKIWKDAGPSSRPEFITINLLQNGVEIKDMDVYPSEGGAWSFLFEDLPQFDEKGKAYTYTITEDPVSGYKETITKEGSSFVITNLRVNEINILGDKVWLDDNNPDRPDEITIYLRQNGKEYKSVVVTPDEEGDWSFEFLKVPEFDLDGLPYTYTIVEKDLEGYKESVKKNEDGSFTVTNLREGIVEVSGEKTWLDDGTGRPDEITIHLLRNGEMVDHRMVSADEAGDWFFEFKNLPEFDETGKAYTYSIKEVPVEGYSTTIDKEEDGTYTVTNLRIGTVDIAGMKTWKDDGTERPESIMVHLFRNGEEIDEQEVMADEEGNWYFSFDGLDAYDDMGIAYIYTVTEHPVEGYETTIEEIEDNYFEITNLRVGFVEISGEKFWLDGGIGRPEEITINLLRNGEVKDSAVVTEGEGGWVFSFTELDEFDEMGLPYKYSIEEVPVEGYDTTITMNEDGTYNVTNLRVGIVDIAGVKTWFDENPEDRPESITVNLIQNGVELKELEVTPDEEGNWTYLFDDLPEFDEEGIAYLYEITEDPVEGYNTFYLENNIQNVRAGFVNVNGVKTWDDLFGRPASITVRLFQNGEEIDDQVVTANAGGTWTYSFTELPEFDDEGKAYVYTIEEDAVPGYEATVEGYNILNRQLRATLRIVKIDDFDLPVEGVVFEVANEDGEVLFTGTTDEDGILETALPLGTYVVTEISAPEDYIMDDEPKTIVLDEDGEVLELTVVNILEIEDIEPLPLPETGSQGTAAFYGLGILMMLGGAVLLSKKRRTVN